MQINDRIKERFSSLDPVVVSIYAEDTILHQVHGDPENDLEEIKEVDGVSRQLNRKCTTSGTIVRWGQAVSLYDSDIEALKNRI